MRPSRPRGAVLPCGIAACLCATACGSSGGEEANVELQVIYGLVGDPVDHHDQVRVRSPRDTKTAGLPFGDPTHPSNWARFPLFLNEGELVEVALRNQNGSVASSGTCTVSGGVQLEYARAFIAGVPFFNGQPLECADGFHDERRSSRGSRLGSLDPRDRSRGAGSIDHRPPAAGVTPLRCWRPLV